jgi:hypothetical protein
VGREEEMQMLIRRWSRAKTGEGQVVFVNEFSHMSDEELAFIWDGVAVLRGSANRVGGE